MNIQKFLLISIFLVLLISNGWAQTTEKSVTIDILPQRFLDEYREPQPEYHYFGGQEVYVPIIINSAGKEGFQLKAEVEQIGFSLKAPYDIKPEIVSSSDTIVNNSRLPNSKLTFFKLPNVKREVVFELSFSMSKKGKDDWKHIKHIKLHVYPRELLKPLQVWSKNVQLRLCDQEGVLVKIFEENEIDFVDYRAATQKVQTQQIITIVVGASAKHFLEGRRGHPYETVILLREKIDTVPNVLVQPYKTGTLIDVHLELINHLTNDPQYQKMLIEIISLTNTLNLGSAK